MVLRPARQAALCALAIVAMFVTDRRNHVAFVSLGLIAQVVWILSQFEVLS